MVINIKTPKVEYTTYINLRQYGRYGKHFLTCEGIKLCEGTHSYCEKVRKEYLSGHRKFRKMFLSYIEQLAQCEKRRKLPKVFTRADKLSFYQAQGYRFRLMMKGLDIYENV